MCGQTFANNIQHINVLFQKERIKLESFFAGLPITSGLLIKSLITLADPTTGIVNNTSYYELAKFLTINPAPGRKDSGTPTKQTIRNYIQLVAAVCGDHFKVITEGQTLQFLFPDIPKLFNNALKSIDVNTGRDSNELHVCCGQGSVFDGSLNTDLSAISDASDCSAKKNTFKALRHIDVNTEPSSDDLLAGIGENHDRADVVNTELNIELNADLNTPNFAVKNNNIFKSSKRRSRIGHL